MTQVGTHCSCCNFLKQVLVESLFVRVLEVYSRHVLYITTARYKALLTPTKAGVVPVDPFLKGFCSLFP